MKTNLKRITSVILALMLLLSIPVFAIAAENIALIDENKDVEFTIHKYNIPSDEEVLGLPEHDGTKLTTEPDYEPLKDVTFNLYFYDVINGEKALNPQAAPEGEPVFTIKTDANGLATVTIPAAQQGIYLVVEDTSTMEDPALVTGKTENFLVALPTTNPDKTDWNYDVHVYPKNYTVLGSVILTKLIDNAPMPEGKSAEFKLQKLDGETYKDLIEGLETDANGKVVVNNLTVGKYQFIETVAPEGYGLDQTPITFEITKNGETAAEDYVVTGHAEEVEFNNSEIPKISKEVSTDEVNFGIDAGVNVGDTVTWKVTTSIPENISSYVKYVVTDTFHEALDFVENSIVITDKDGNKLVDGEDYSTVLSGKTVSIVFMDNTATVSLFGGEIFENGENVLSKYAGTNLTIKFKTVINDKAVMGEEIENKATLSYDNGSGQEGDVDSNIPEVHTGGIKFIKYDKKTNAVLADAEFSIYKTEEDAKAGTNAIKVATSDENGLFEFTGLAYGNLNDKNNVATTDYYMVETKAPAGYQLTGQVFQFTIDKDSYDVAVTDASRQIFNTLQPTLPLTGGIGTAIFIIAGLALISGAAVILVKSKKSKKDSISE